MAKAVLVLVIMSVSNTIAKRNKDIEKLIVEGTHAAIEDFGYAAYLRIECDSKDWEATTSFSCGSSILNQDFLLTAAHCIVDCQKTSFVGINLGSADKHKGIQRSSSKFLTHEKYGVPGMENDIALIKLKASLQFSDTVYRVALMRNPPQETVAVVSGWGLTNELDQTREKFMKYTKQSLWSRSSCQQVIYNIPKGAFCAGKRKAESYASFGDSGGALVVNKSIQIGIVSYKIIEISRSLAVYTNVSYYFNWIQTNTRQLNC